MNKIDEYLVGITSVGITGHVRPDGDCIGSCLALYNYITCNFVGIDVEVYLETIPDKFSGLYGIDEIKMNYITDKNHDLFIVLDTSDLNRIGEAIKYFNSAKKTLSIDHHISNQYFADENIVFPKASSASEVLYGLLEEEKINKDIALALYTGIVFDSGVFKYTNTSEITMQIAGKLMSFGIPFTKIIDESFYSKTYNQSLVLGRALLDSILVLSGKCAYTVVTKKTMEFYKVSNKELDGIVDQLRLIQGVECAMFIYEVDEKEYKVSLRSNELVDVNMVAGYFGGGGHIRASGFTFKGDIGDMIHKILRLIEKQI